MKSETLFYFLYLFFVLLVPRVKVYTKIFELYFNDTKTIIKQRNNGNNSNHINMKMQRKKIITTKIKVYLFGVPVNLVWMQKRNIGVYVHTDDSSHCTHHCNRIPACTPYSCASTTETTDKLCLHTKNYLSFIRFVFCAEEKMKENIKSSSDSSEYYISILSPSLCLPFSFCFILAWKHTRIPTRTHEH